MLTIYEVTIPVFTRGLGILSELLRKGEAHCRAGGFDPDFLVSARLAPDMLPLAGQVQRASDTAKFAASRLIGTQAPSYRDDEVTLAQLQERITRTDEFLRSVKESQFAGSDVREITIGFSGTARKLNGTRYVLTHALPNFFFHVTTAYDILRHNNVQIGKRDYLWLPTDAPA